MVYVGVMGRDSVFSGRTGYSDSDAPLVER